MTGREAEAAGCAAAPARCRCLAVLSWHSSQQQLRSVRGGAGAPAPTGGGAAQKVRLCTRQAVHGVSMKTLIPCHSCHTC